MQRRRVLPAAAAVLALAASLAVPASAHAPVPEPKIVRGESCVEPVDVMRRDHMDMLMHQRDRTVIAGVRTPRHSLTGCIECHADTDDSGAWIRVDAPGQFCSTCHEYAAVRVDCFSCHAAVPGYGDAAGAPHE